MVKKEWMYWELSCVGSIGKVGISRRLVKFCGMGMSFGLFKLFLEYGLSYLLIEIDGYLGKYN